MNITRQRFGSGMFEALRLIVRRDRARLVAWLLGFPFFVIAMVPLLDSMLSSPIERTGMRMLMENPMLVALLGPVFGAENYTIGAAFANDMHVFSAIFVAIFNIITTSRHTRHDEADGRLDLFYARPVRRLTWPLAVYTVTTLTNIVLGVISTLGLIAFAAEGMNALGAMIFGLTMTLTGCFFSALTMLFAQWAKSGRATSFAAMATLLLTYSVRAYGDVKGNRFSYLSPLGLILQTRLYVENRSWPLLPLTAATLILFLLAVRIFAGRELGLGLFTSKSGRTNASPRLKSGFTVTVRLLFPSFFVWAICLSILSGLYGSVFGDLERFLNSSAFLKIFLIGGSGSLIDQFVSMLIQLISVFNTVPALYLLLRLADEEKKGRLELLLSRPLSRLQTAGSYIALSVLSSVILQILTTTALWTIGSGTDAVLPSLSSLYTAAALRLPAIWFCLGLGILLIGCFPKKVTFAWIHLIFNFLVVYMGRLAGFPDFVMKISVFSRIESFPIKEIDVAGVIIPFILASISLVVGLIAYCRRDLTGD